MARRKTHEEFVEELKIKNPNVEVLERYINTDTKIKVKCKKCKNIWTVRPSDLLRHNNTGCPKCNIKIGGLKRTKTNSSFKNELNNINPDVDILTEYINSYTKVKVKCKICENIWFATPNALISQHCGCPLCSIKKQTLKRTKKHDIFIEELTNINPDIEILDKYINNHTKIKCKCRKCGCVWNTMPNYLIGERPTGCPSCNIKKSKKRINEYLELHNIKYIPQKTFNGLLGLGGGLLSYDFYLPKHDLLIEYQGEFHDGSIKTGFQSPRKLKRQLEHDKRKRKYAKEHNIELLEIWYWDFNNIEQIMSEKLNINSNKKSV